MPSTTKSDRRAAAVPIIALAASLLTACRADVAGDAPSDRPSAGPGQVATAGGPAATVTTVSPARPLATSVPGAKPLMTTADGDETTGDAPLTVELSVAVAEGTGTPPFTHVWDFGDATPFSTESRPRHVYRIPGNFRASVITTGADGETDQDWVDVYVSPAFEAMGMSLEERLRLTREAAARLHEAMEKGSASNPGGAAAGPTDVPPSR